MEKTVIVVCLVLMIMAGLILGVSLPTVEVSADETSDERFEIMDYQQVGLLQVRIVCDKETKLVYTWAYAVDRGGRIGGVSIEPLYASDGGVQLMNLDCGK